LGELKFEIAPIGLDADEGIFGGVGNREEDAVVSQIGAGCAGFGLRFRHSSALLAFAVWLGLFLSRFGLGLLCGAAIVGGGAGRGDPAFGAVGVVILFEAP